VNLSKLFVGAFYGTQVKPMAVVADGFLYPVLNLDQMEKLGYGNTMQDGRPVLAVCDPAAYGVAVREEGPHKKWTAGCYLVPAAHVEFRPECRPIIGPVGGFQVGVLHEFLVRDLEGRRHVVVACDPADAISNAKAAGITMGTGLPRSLPCENGQLWVASLHDAAGIPHPYVKVLAACEGDALDLLKARYDSHLDDPSGELAVLSLQPVPDTIIRVEGP
jgi:hypothetical protein